jgi:glycosyltransferase involved in cell wall biosynthesis
MTRASTLYYCEADKTMRILHVVSALAGGGAEIFVKDLALSCVRMGHDLAIAYISSAKDQGNEPSIESQFRSDLTLGRVTVFEIGHSARKNPPLGAWRLRRIIKQFRPDILHIHLGQGLVFRTLTFTSVPTLYTHHNIIFKFGHTLTAVFDRFIDSYIAICKSCEELLRSRTQRPITLIRNGISDRRVAAQNTSRGTGFFKVLTVGRVSPQKNYQSIIRIATVCKKYSDTHIQFQICGEGAGIEGLRSAARSAGVENNVHFLGGRSDVPELMAASDVVLMTSIYEGMPITLIEAAHAGLPLIATDVGGCSEVVQHGVNGYLFKPNDHEIAAGYLMKLQSDAALRKKMSQQSLQIAREFGMQRVTDQHIQLYRTLLIAA